MYAEFQFKFEDFNRIKSELELFKKAKSKLANKDINSYKNLDQLYNILEPYSKEDLDLSSKNEKKKEIKKDAKKIIDTPNFKVIIPETHEAACYYGANTKWCTASHGSDSESIFNNYNKNGPLYIIIAKQGTNDKKFQLHYETDQFMNERDQMVKKTEIDFLSKFYQYKDFLNYLIKKHYKNIK